MWDYEALLEKHGCAAVWGNFDENTAAGLCYTSGTTGKPKGVVYSHRSNYLHTLFGLQGNAIGLTVSDVLLVAVPMFHANGWGLPFAAPAAGAKLVLPGRQTDGASLAAILRDEEVNIAAGIHTLWQGVLDHLDQVGGELPALKRVLIGGAICPRCADRADREAPGRAGANQLGHDRAFADGHNRPARHASGGKLDFRTAADGDGPYAYGRGGRYPP